MPKKILGREVNVPLAQVWFVCIALIVILIYTW